MQRLGINLKRSDEFVKNQQNHGVDIRWDGWEMIFFREYPTAVFSKDGVFRNGKWGYEQRVSPNVKGVWEVDFRNIKRIRQNALAIRQNASSIKRG